MPVIDLSAFSYRQQQDCLTLLETFANAGVTDLAAIRRELGKPFAGGRVYAPKPGARQKTSSRARTAVTICAACGYKAVVKQVNTCRSTRIGGRWKSAICCTNEDCLHVELSIRQPWEIN